MKIIRVVYLSICIALGTTSIIKAQTSNATASTENSPKVLYKNNTVFWRDSVLVHHQNGQFTPVSSAIKYPNGNSISADGMVRLANGKTQKLKTHQALSPQGKIVLAADDIFTLATIQQTEKQVVGDTETKIFLMNGQLVSAGSNTSALDTQKNTEKQIALLKQMNTLLEQRTKLVEANLSDDKKAEINAQVNLLDAKISAIDRRLKSKSSTSTQ